MNELTPEHLAQLGITLHSDGTFSRGDIHGSLEDITQAMSIFSGQENKIAIIDAAAKFFLNVSQDTGNDGPIIATKMLATAIEHIEIN
jgi:hypothetical protein